MTSHEDTTTATFAIRGAAATDLDACVALLALHEATGAGSGSVAVAPVASCSGTGAVADTGADPRSRVRAWFRRPDTCFLVAAAEPEHPDRADPATRVAAYARAVFLDPTPTAPAGYYLGGVVVAPEARRSGLATRLTAARLAWIAERAPEAWYFTNARNDVSLRLHEPFGFHEETREFTIPGVEFAGGVGVLAHAVLDGPPCPLTDRRSSPGGDR
ncbi:GNAT family N-acetyltransferase [Embleya sp. NBC_00896]|uniref:GNAT family N-acetyltransferase n=1 Tax=Embleya sp. NBC_00896 TaxID=2975961 RepID=UPI003869D525|nr:GNAT family N-acetyltransferase [Embleya sp. NBC_00896]